MRIRKFGLLGANAALLMSVGCGEVDLEPYDPGVERKRIPVGYEDVPGDEPSLEAGVLAPGALEASQNATYLAFDAEGVGTEKGDSFKIWHPGEQPAAMRIVHDGRIRTIALPPRCGGCAHSNGIAGRKAGLAGESP